MLALLGRGLLFTALTGLVGLATVRLLRQTTRDAETAYITPSDLDTRLGILLSAVGLVAMLLVGAGQLIAFRDPFAALSEDVALLAASPWGQVWTLGMVGFVVAFLAHVTRGLRNVAWVLAPLLALYPAVTGHSASAGPLAPATMALDWVHVLAAGAWIGSLSVLLWIGRPTRMAARAQGRAWDAHLPVLVRVLPVFSLVARAGVVLLILTGTAAAWVHLTGPGDLVTTPWGRVLSVKLGVVALALALGYWNWRVLSPRARKPGGSHRLVQAARVEALLGVAILLVTAWLTGTAPPP